MNIEAAAFEHIDDLLFEFFNVLFAEEFLGFSEDDRDFERVGLDFLFGVPRDVDAGEVLDVDRAILGGKRQGREQNPCEKDERLFHGKEELRIFVCFRASGRSRQRDCPQIGLANKVAKLRNFLVCYAYFCKT